MPYTVSQEDKRTGYQRYLEGWVNLIKDPDLQESVRAALRMAPSYFWTKGYYHTSAPVDEQAQCGMLRRIYKDCYYVRPLTQAWRLDEHHDVILAATLLHDCLKYGTEDLSVPKKKHGPDTADWLRGIWGLDANETPEHPLIEKLNAVADIIYYHDGTAWCDDPVVEEIGQSQDLLQLMGWLINTVDQVSSRPLTYFVWEG
jgi:hypothetical protein